MLSFSPTILVAVIFRRHRRANVEIVLYPQKRNDEQLDRDERVCACKSGDGATVRSLKLEVLFAGFVLVESNQIRKKHVKLLEIPYVITFHPPSFPSSSPHLGPKLLESVHVLCLKDRTEIF